MTTDEAIFQRLRAAWEEESEDSPAPAGCAEPASFWAAVRGEASSAESRRIVLHAAACPACEAALRLARELAAAEPEALREPARGRLLPWALAAAAAVVVLLTLTPWLLRETSNEAPVFRDEGETAIQSLIRDGEALPRDRFLLRWSAGPPGTRYTISVSRRDLTVVASARALDHAEWQVPPEALASSEPDTILYWRVEAHPPDGGVLVSPMFPVRVR